MRIELDNITITCSVTEWQEIKKDFLPEKTEQIFQSFQAARGNNTERHRRARARAKEKKADTDKVRKKNLTSSLEQQEELVYNPFLHQVTGVTRKECNCPLESLEAVEAWFKEKIACRRDFLKKEYPTARWNPMSFMDALLQLSSIHRHPESFKPKYDEGWYHLGKQIEAGDVFQPPYPQSFRTIARRINPLHADLYGTSRRLTWFDRSGEKLEMFSICLPDTMHKVTKACEEALDTKAKEFALIFTSEYTDSTSKEKFIRQLRNTYKTYHRLNEGMDFHEFVHKDLTRRFEKHEVYRKILEIMKHKVTKPF